MQLLLPRRGAGGRQRGRRGGKQGRKGNGLATNCTITTFRKRKNHSVLFLCTICFPLLPPTLQFRGKEEKPELRAHSRWAAGRARNTARGYMCKWGGAAPSPCTPALPAGSQAGMASTHERECWTALRDHGGPPNYCPGQRSVCSI